VFPLLMTAAGTLSPARVLVLGAGVAGLQAIATARRLGAVVEGYDIRPAAMEQIASVGAKPIMLDLDFEEAEDEGGYAREQAADVNRRQNEALLPYVADADVVITTAAIPGAASPELITTDMVEAMRPGSVVVDLAAERGGNCRMTKPDDEVNHGGVIILGPTDLPSRAAASASLMFSNNIVTLLRHLAPEGELQWDLNDEITAGTLIGWDREVMHPRIRQLLELPPFETSPDGGGDRDPEAATGQDATDDRAGSDRDGAEDRDDDDHEHDVDDHEHEHDERDDDDGVVHHHVDDGASGEDGADNGENPGHQRPHQEREQS
jgi:NAD(P) transhydrogenase subunit alpha